MHTSIEKPVWLIVAQLHWILFNWSFHLVHFVKSFENHENLEEANTIKARKEKGKEWESWRLWVPMAIYLLSTCGVYVSSKMLENKTLRSQG